MYLLMGLQLSMTTHDVVLITIRNILAAIMRDSRAFKLYKVMATFLSAANALFFGRIWTRQFTQPGSCKRIVKKNYPLEIFYSKIAQAKCQMLGFAAVRFFVQVRASNSFFTFSIVFLQFLYWPSTITQHNFYGIIENLVVVVAFFY